MSPLLFIPLGLVLLVAAIGAALLLVGASKRTGDDDISDFIRTNQGRSLPRSPVRKKRGW